MSGGGLDWDRDGRDWPNRESSRFVEAAGLRWHVQVAGAGPPLLLVHGTGAASHSWRDLLPELATTFTVIAPDLPGHGFTASPPPERMSMAGMGRALSALLHHLDLPPRLAVGHSAGAALLVSMTLDALIAPAGIVSFNGALLPIGGAAGRLFPPLARVLSGSRLAADMLSSWAGYAANTGVMIAQTGSRLDQRGLALYRRVAGDPAHVRGALAMMARWDLERLDGRLPRLATPLALVVGSRDGSVSPVQAEIVRRRVKSAVVEKLRGLGHLAHEEDPAGAIALIRRYADAWSAGSP